MPLTAPDDIAALLTNARTIALVGASDRPDRATGRAPATTGRSPRIRIRFQG